MQELRGLELNRNSRLVIQALHFTYTFFHPMTKPKARLQKYICNILKIRL